MKPSIEQLIEKFPEMRRNSRVLRDFACPNCGSRGPFDGTVTIQGPISDRHPSWEDNEPEVCMDREMYCGDCEHSAPARQFYFEGLDHKLRERTDHGRENTESA